MVKPKNNNVKGKRKTNVSKVIARRCRKRKGISPATRILANRRTTLSLIENSKDRCSSFRTKLPCSRYSCQKSFGHTRDDREDIGRKEKNQLGYNLRLRKPKCPLTLITPYDFKKEASYITRRKFGEKYRLCRKKLGEGGFGKVYGGVRLDGCPVAVKKVRKRNCGDLVQFEGIDAPEEFVHQLRASTISNAIVKPLDLCQDHSHYIIVMEHPTSSISLEEYVLKGTDVIPEKEVRFIFKQLLDSIEKLHKNKIIHRDIKAENVLIDRNTKEVKLIDFGCATYDRREDFTSLCGTEQQFPPEFFIYQRYNGKKLDLWCLAQVLYFLVECRYPFETVEDIMGCEVTLTVADGHVRDLLYKMLHPEEESRLSIEQIKKHPYMTTSNTS